MKKRLMAILLSAAVLTATIPTLFASAQTAADMDVYEASASDWTASGEGISVTDSQSGGVDVIHSNSADSTAYYVTYNNPISLDGAHINLTLNYTNTQDSTAEYWARIFAVKLYNSDSPDQYLRFKVDTYGQQFSAWVNDEAIDHTGYVGYNGQHVDRVFIPDYVNSTIPTYNIRFFVSVNNDVTVIINGYSLTVPHSVIGDTITDYGNVKFSISPMSEYTGAGALSYVLNYFHGGADSCSEDYKSVSEVEAMIAMCNPDKPIGKYVLAARRAYNALDAEEKATVSNYNVLTMAETANTDSDQYHYGMSSDKLRPDLVAWGWPVTFTDTSSGVSITHSAYWNEEVRSWTSGAFALDGARIHLTTNTPVSDAANYYKSLFTLSFTCSSNNNIVGDLYLKFDLVGGGQMFVGMKGTDKVTQWFSMEGVEDAWPGDNYGRIMSNKLNTNELELLFDIDSDGGLNITANGIQIYVTSEQMAGITDLTDLNNVHLGIAGVDNGLPDITVNCLVDGKDKCYDYITGDVNNDGICDVRDLIRIKKYNAGATSDIMYYRNMSDINNDGAIDITDMVTLRKQILG